MTGPPAALGGLFVPLPAGGAGEELRRAAAAQLTGWTAEEAARGHGVSREAVAMQATALVWPRLALHATVAVLLVRNLWAMIES